MTALATAIVTAKPREKAGARTGARYAFQAHVSLAKVLDLHKAGGDYRAVFDHFDDLTLLDSSTLPSHAEFFQIKGKESGDWTAANFCAVGKDTPRTIVGKMFHHTTVFGAAVKSATFLTNAAFKFELASGKRSTPDHVNISLADLGPKDKARLAAALELDFPSPRSPDESALIVFSRTNVPVKGYDLLLKGRLVDLLDGTDGVGVNAAYRTIIEDITAKANDTTECSSLEEVFAHKSLGRGDIQKVLDAAAARDSILDNSAWAVVDNELVADGRSYRDRLRIRTATVEYLRNRSKRVREATAFSAAAKLAVNQVGDAMDQAQGVLDAANAIRHVIPAIDLPPYEPLDLEAALLAEAFEALNG
jgi:hypothetical protein